MIVTFENVTISIHASSEEEAYQTLCKAVAAVAACWGSDTYTVADDLGRGSNRSYKTDRIIRSLFGFSEEGGAK